MTMCESDYRPARSATDRLDRLGVGASLLCLIHCLALPFVLAALPALTSLLSVPESFHLWVLAFAFPTSCLALIGGRLRHGAFYPVFVGIAGLTLLALGAIPFGETQFETPITVIGGLMLAVGHAANWRLRHASYRHG